MKDRHGRSLGLALLLAVGACTSGSQGTDATVASPTAPSDPSPTPTVRDVLELPNFAPLEPGTYVIDPDADASTPLRVLYEVPVEGWSQWIGAAKFSGDGHVGVSISTVENWCVMGAATIRRPIHRSDRAWTISQPRWRTWPRSG